MPFITRVLISVCLLSVVCFPALGEDEKEKPEGAQSTTEKGAPAQDKVEGTLKMGDASFPLTHIVAFESKVLDEIRVNVLVSNTELPLDKLKESLQKDGTDDDLFVHDPHVKVTFDKEGKVSFCSAWAEGTSVSRSGGDLIGEMKLKNGRVEGSASMKPKEDSFSKCDYDFKFEAALMPAPKLDEPKPKSSKGSKSKKPAAKKPSGSIFDLLPKDTKKSVNKSDDDSDEEEMKEETEEASEPKGEEVSVYDIPMPKDAKDVKYKKLVEMMEYKSDSSVEAVAEYLVENLKKQGWESDDSDLINENTAIIKREKGTAELTIFVKPDGEGSKVNMMSDGLSWEKKTKPESKESEK